MLGYIAKLQNGSILFQSSVNSIISGFKMREYCVAIRTLGTAGEKYQKLLDSIKEQTIQPKHIFVHIAEGYKLPKETIGIEQYVRCPKGMIAQRSLPFDEIDTDYVLFCDDDLYLPPNCVERMFEGLQNMNGDCIAANVYNEEQMSLWKKQDSSCIVL